LPITFTCECGEEISVLDGMEGKIAVCASCRKAQRIPGGPSDEKDASSASGLFREALAAFGERSEDGEGRTDPSSEADTRVMGASKAQRDEGHDVPSADEPPPAVKAALDGPPEALAQEHADPDDIDTAGGADHGRDDAPKAPESEEPLIEEAEDARATGRAPPVAEGPASGPSSSGDEGGPSTKDALPVEYAAKVMEQREIKRAIRREGEPDSPAGAFEPKDVELHGNVMKFHCRCGKRISVPVDARKTIGRCPKCGARLVVPKASQANPTERPKGKARSADARARNVRRATAEAADRLRKSGGKGKRATRGERPKLVRESWPARVVAALADAAIAGAALVGTFCIIGGGEWAARAVVPTVVLGGGAWCANRLVVQWIFGSSIGMMVGGVRLAYPDGRPLSFPGNLLRALAGPLLLPLAPVALWDEKRRTPADRAAGTVVLSSR